MQRVGNTDYRDPDYTPPIVNGSHQYSTGLIHDEGARTNERHRMQFQDTTEIIVPDDYDPFTGTQCLINYPARNQGSCGSCYAFAAATMLSLRYCLAGAHRGVLSNAHLTCRSHRLTMIPPALGPTL